MINSFLTVKEEGTDKVSPMLISNHVSWMDILYLSARIYPMSIVSKEAVSRVPLIGLIARYHQCLFTLRESE